MSLFQKQTSLDDALDPIRIHLQYKSLPKAKLNVKGDIKLVLPKINSRKLYDTDEVTCVLKNSKDLCEVKVGGYIITSTKSNYPKSETLTIDKYDGETQDIKPAIKFIDNYLQQWKLYDNICEKLVCSSRYGTVVEEQSEGRFKINFPNTFETQIFIDSIQALDASPVKINKTYKLDVPEVLMQYSEHKKRVNLSVLDPSNNTTKKVIDSLVKCMEHLNHNDLVNSGKNFYVNNFNRNPYLNLAKPKKRLF